MKIKTDRFQHFRRWKTFVALPFSAGFIFFSQPSEGRLGFIVYLTAMQMLKHWNVPQTRADGYDKPRPFSLKEHDITTYGRSDWSAVRERWPARRRELVGDARTQQRPNVGIAPFHLQMLLYSEKTLSSTRFWEAKWITAWHATQFTSYKGGEP